MAQGDLLRLDRLRIGIHDAFGQLAAGGFQNQLRRALAGPIANADVRAALEAVDWIRCADPSFLEVRADVLRLEIGALDEHVHGVRSLISLFWPPMTPASAMPFCSSAISSISLVSVRSWSSSVLNFSPALARRTTMVVAPASAAASDPRRTPAATEANDNQTRAAAGRFRASRNWSRPRRC